MKITFKHFAIIALAISVGFASCNKTNGDNPTPDFKTKTVSVDINVKGANSRALGSTSARDVTPALSDVKLFFVGDGFIQQIETITTSGTFEFTVPMVTTKVYAVGNAEELSSPILPTVGNPESAIQSVMLEVDKQVSPQDVNMSQGQGVTTGASFVDDVAAVTLMPAVARYEIQKVSADDSAIQPLKDFKLSAIYITNTYRTMALDYATVPTIPADIINAGPNSDLTTAVPSYLKDQVGATEAATFFTPGGENTYWGYFLSAPVAGKGTTLVGSTTQESSVPIIILEIKDAVAKTGTMTYNATSYVNVRKLIQSGETEPITALEPGNVYIIENIAIGGEHLTDKPGEEHNREVTVNVIVQKWNGVNVTPSL